MDKTKKIRVAINGFGRIGRAAFKIALEKDNLEVVAVNDLTDNETLANLLKRDTVYGEYEKTVKAVEKKEIKSDACKGSLEVGGKLYPVLSEKDPEKLPWKDLNIDVVIESTGFFCTKEDAQKHIKAGAKKVIISAPGKGEGVSTQVISVTEPQEFKGDVVSNASCTTNCIAPISSIIQEEFGIEKAMMTTIHAYTADQNLIDGPHKDLRRARAAAHNMVPTTTGAAVAVTKVIPALAGKFDGISVRVPIIVGSLSDLTFLLKKNTSKEEVNEVLKKAANTPRFKRILQVTEDPIVSSDIIGNSHSAIVDLPFTNVVDKNLLKILAWYDNEWGYANRLVEMVGNLNI